MELHPEKCLIDLRATVGEREREREKERSVGLIQIDSTLFSSEPLIYHIYIIFLIISRCPAYAVGQELPPLVHVEERLSWLLHQIICISTQYK